MNKGGFPVFWLLAGAVALGALLPGSAWAATANDPVVPVLLHLSVILAFAKLCGWAAVRLKQPAVLGELLAGILLGNLAIVGITAFEGIRTDPVLATLASLGVIVLLFEVGLESTVRQMMQVGTSALLVAVLGLIDQPSTDPLNEISGKQRPARPARAGNDGRLDRPHAPLAEMVGRLAIGLGDDEPGLSIRLRPVER